MATRSFESLVYKLSPSVPGCPQPTIVQYIRDAAIRTCERTLSWRYQIPVFNLSPGVVEYPFNQPVDTDVHAIFEAVVNCNPLDRVTLEQAIHRYPCWADLFNGVDLQTIWGQSGSFNSPQYNQVPYNGSGLLVYPDEALEGARDPLIITQINADGYIVLPMPDDDKDYEMRMFVALKPKYHAKQYLFHLTERRARANLGNARATLTARAQPFGV